MKVIFVDIDGTLRDDNDTKEVFSESGNHKYVNFCNLEKFDILAEICKKYDLKVVVSSAWKVDSSKIKIKNKSIEETNYGLKELHEILNDRGVELYGYTPDVPNPGAAWCQNMCKEYDITSFLIEHPEVTDYVIVDDLIENDLYSLNNHLLQTKFDEDGKGNGGLRPRHIDEIEKYILPRETYTPEEMEENELYKEIKYSELNPLDLGQFGLMIKRTMEVYGEIHDVRLHISLTFDKKTVIYHWYDEDEYQRGILRNYEEFLKVLRFLNFIEEKKEEDPKKLIRRP